MIIKHALSFKRRGKVCKSFHFILNNLMLFHNFNLKSLNDTEFEIGSFTKNSPYSTMNGEIMEKVINMRIFTNSK